MVSSKIKGLDFIANGDVAIVTAIHGTETYHKFNFANVTLTLPDRDIDVQCRIFLNTLVDESAALSNRSEERV